MSILIWAVIIPAIGGIFVLAMPEKYRIRDGFAVLAAAANLALAAMLFNKELSCAIPWGMGFVFSLKLYRFSAFIFLAAAFFAFLITLYSFSFLKNFSKAGLFYSFLLISCGMANGAVMADNLIVLLFFWEGLLLTLFGLIIIGNKGAYRTAIKAFIIAGVTDLCMMFGIALTYHISGTFAISEMSIPLHGLASAAFIFLMIGAISKAGSMPFHSWIPDAAADAPLPFMAFLPASLEKLLGIYFLTRISLDMFVLDRTSWVSTLLMIIGAATILCAVMMALVQKEFKKLLSYHAISQVGYMILGIGTALPVGIVGGLFHMINNALYKSGLFLTAGSVEKQAGTTDLDKLGGLSSKMPVTFWCFAVCAVAISGVPPFNGFFSKELIYDAALERGWVFYAAASLGSFFTAASFLKLGHAAFLGKPSASAGNNNNVKESPLPMLIPIITVSLVCILFGLYNAFPVKSLILPAIGEARMGVHHFSGMPANMALVIITVIVLAAALINHIFGVKRTGRGAGAVDHIHHAPVLSSIYEKAAKESSDPYEIALKGVNLISKTAWYMDRFNDYIYNVLAVKAAYLTTSALKVLHTGSHSRYILWSLFGAAAVILGLMR